MSRKIFVMLFVVFCVFALCGAASAEDMLGINVYPGAKPDAGTSAFLKDSLNMNGAAYRTEDSVEKVITFYKGLSNLKFSYGDSQSALFKDANSGQVTIQSPWMDMKTGQMMNDTLISIVRSE